MLEDLPKAMCAVCNIASLILCHCNLGSENLNAMYYDAINFLLQICSMKD